MCTRHDVIALHLGAFACRNTSFNLYIFLTVVTVSFDQPIYVAQESGDVLVTLSLDRGIATSFFVDVQAGGCGILYTCHIIYI